MPKKLKPIFFFLIFLFLVSTASLALAARERWKTPEVQYPQLPAFFNTETPNQFIPKIQSGEYPPEKALPLYVKYFYSLFLIASGFIAFGAVVYGGFQYLISAGSPPKTLAARDQISGGIMGLAILLSSYLILITLNPQLTIFSMPGLRPSAPASETPTLSESEKRFYFQIPVGKAVERAALDSEGQRKLNEAENAAREMKQKSEDLKNLVLRLNELVSSCRCGDTISCGGANNNCPATGCSGPCNTAAIAEKINQIQRKNEEIRTVRQRIMSARWDLEDSLNELANTGSLMSPAGCLEIPIPYREMINQMEVAGGEISAFHFYRWNDIRIIMDGREIDDPATFYCSKPVLNIIGGGATLPTVSSSLTACPAPPSPWTPPPQPLPPPIPPAPPPTGEWQWPIDNFTVSQWFGNSPYPYPSCPNYNTDDLHNGIDFVGDREIKSAADGVVVSAGSCDGYGIMVAVNHGGGIVSLYGHLERVSVSEGDRVTKGQIIGRMDRTGNCFCDPPPCDPSHLHFSIYVNAPERPSCSWFIGAGYCSVQDPRSFLP